MNSLDHTNWWDFAIDLAVIRYQTTGRKHRVFWNTDVGVWAITPTVYPLPALEETAS